MLTRVQAYARDGMLLALRLATGWLFVCSNWGKLHHLAQVAEYFKGLHVLWPAEMAPIVASLELLGGLMLVAGLVTRVWALVLVALMGAAIVHAHSDDIASLADLLGLQEFLLAQTLGVLATFGAGAWSLDA